MYMLRRTSPKVGDGSSNGGVCDFFDCSTVACFSPYPDALRLTTLLQTTMGRTRVDAPPEDAEVMFPILARVSTLISELPQFLRLKQLGKDNQLKVADKPLDLESWPGRISLLAISSVSTLYALGRQNSRNPVPTLNGRLTRYSV